MALLQPIPGYACTGKASCRGGTPFVSYHQAVDFPAPGGTPVVAIADGTIAEIGWELPGLWGGGNEIRLAFTVTGPGAPYGPSIGTTCEADYCHLEAFAAGLKKGDQVRAGQTIGYVGKTSDAAHRALLKIPGPTGTHLHLIVKIGGVAVDVREYVAGGPSAVIRFGLKGGAAVAQGPAGNQVRTAPRNPDGTCPTGYKSGADIRKLFTDQGFWGWLAVSSPVGIPGFSESVGLDDNTCYSQQDYAAAAFDQAQKVPQADDVFGWVAPLVRDAALLIALLAMLLIGIYVLVKQSGASGGGPSIAVG